MRTIKQILEAFKKDLRIGYQAQKNVVDISERYIHELSEADLGGKGGIDYTTEEQDTGLKWIDGRTVYQKTISVESIGDVQTYRYPVSSLGVELIIKIDCVMRLGSANSNQWITVPYTENANYRISCYWMESVNEIFLRSNWGVTAAYITIQYIKSE